jgi:hypothetical protein
MTDEELVKALRDFAEDAYADLAADRIEELGRLTRGQEEQLEIQGNELCRRASHGHKQADRIEALTAENERLERVVKDISDEANLAEQEACMVENDFVKAEKEIEALTAKLAKAVKALTFYANEENYKGVSLTDPCGCCSSWYDPKIHIGGEDSGHIARATLAEIEGEKG